MIDAQRYKPTVAWRTKAENVYLLTQEDASNPATYRFEYKAIDTNETGAGEVVIGYGFIDNLGVPFEIIAFTATTIDVADIFRTEHCPHTGKAGIVYKSVWKGRSIILPPAMYRFLHPLAILNRDKYKLDILWSNDPNARKFEFTNVTQVQITDWTADIVDTNGDTYNPKEDWGQNPKFEVWQINGDNTFSKLQTEPYITRDANDEIISVIFSGTGETFNAHLIISK